MINVINDLVAWLTQIHDADRAEAEAAANVYGSAWVGGEHSETVSGANGGYVACGPYDGFLQDEFRVFIARNDPAAVLARIEAERAICTQYTDACASYESIRAAFADDQWPHHGSGERARHYQAVTALRTVVRILGTAYAGRPGYQEDWRP